MEFQHHVVARMLGGRRKHLKVRRIIVPSVSINVMYDLPREKRTSEDLLGHDSVGVAPIGLRIGLAGTGIKAGFPEFCSRLWRHPFRIQLLVHGAHTRARESLCASLAAEVMFHTCGLGPVGFEYFTATVAFYYNHIKSN